MMTAGGAPFVPSIGGSIRTHPKTQFPCVACLKGTAESFCQSTGWRGVQNPQHLTDKMQFQTCKGVVKIHHNGIQPQLRYHADDFIAVFRLHGHDLSDFQHAFVQFTVHDEGGFGYFDVRLFILFAVCVFDRKLEVKRVARFQAKECRFRRRKDLLLPAMNPKGSSAGQISNSSESPLASRRM